MTYYSNQEFVSMLVNVNFVFITKKSVLED